MDYETLKTAYSIFKEYFYMKTFLNVYASNYKTELKN